MAVKTRRIVQVFFLIAFTILIMTGKVQAWMVVFAASIAGAALFGRFYCGFICPSDAVGFVGGEAHAVIQKGLCLECTACSQVCPGSSKKYK